MKKTLLILSTVLLLCGCGEVPSSSSSGDNGSSTTPPTTSIVTSTGDLTLRMFGDLYPNGTRTIYLETEDYKDEEISW